MYFHIKTVPWKGKLQHQREDLFGNVQIEAKLHRTKEELKNIGIPRTFEQNIKSQNSLAMPTKGKNS